MRTLDCFDRSHRICVRNASKQLLPRRLSAVAAGGRPVNYLYINRCFCDCTSVYVYVEVYGRVLCIWRQIVCSLDRETGRLMCGWMR